MAIDRQKAARHSDFKTAQLYIEFAMGEMRAAIAAADEPPMTVGMASPSHPSSSRT